MGSYSTIPHAWWPKIAAEDAAGMPGLKRAKKHGVSGTWTMACLGRRISGDESSWNAERIINRARRHGQERPVRRHAALEEAVNARITRAVTSVERAGVAYCLHEYVHEATHSVYGQEAADTLQLDRSHVFRTLIAEVVFHCPLGRRGRSDYCGVKPDAPPPCHWRGRRSTAVPWGGTPGEMVSGA